jgi:hypothetical protein
VSNDLELQLYLKSKHLFCWSQFLYSFAVLATLLNSRSRNTEYVGIWGAYPIVLDRAVTLLDAKGHCVGAQIKGQLSVAALLQLLRKVTKSEQIVSEYCYLEPCRLLDDLSGEGLVADFHLIILAFLYSLCI